MTREEAIEYLFPIAESAALPRYKEALGMAIAALREQASLENGKQASEKKTSEKKTSEKKTSDWISVSERLPEKITNKVLVCCKNGYVGFGHYEKFQGVEEWYNLESGKPFREWDLEDCETYEVTHWMPLPEPPKD